MIVLWRRISFSPNKTCSIHSRPSTNHLTLSTNSNRYYYLLGNQLRSSLRLLPFFSFQHTYSTNYTPDDSILPAFKYRCLVCSKVNWGIPIGSKCEGCGTFLKETDYRELCDCFCKCMDLSPDPQQPGRCLCGCSLETTHRIGNQIGN